MVQRVWLKVFVCTGVVLLVGFGSQAQETESVNKGKAAWEWSTEERLAERFDPVKVEERRKAAVDRALHQSPALENKAIHDPSRTFIQGRETPELFLPWELYNSMIQKAFLTDPEYGRVYKEEILAGAGDFGKRDDLWPMVEMLSSEVIAIKQKMIALGNDPAYHDIDDERYAELREQRKVLGLESCRARFVALQAVREHFGAAAFDRFLYEAIAPSHNVFYAWDGENVEMSEEKRFVAGGCQ